MLQLVRWSIFGPFGEVPATSIGLAFHRESYGNPINFGVTEYYVGSFISKLAVATIVAYFSSQFPESEWIDYI